MSRRSTTEQPRRSRRPAGLSSGIRIGWAAIAVAVSTVLLAGGCASYTDEIQESQVALSNGEHQRAIETYNRQLGVDSAEDRPRSLEDHNVLLLLERATLLQSVGRYETASRDMVTVDDRLEWLDLGSDVADTILQYVYSDDAGPYRAPPHERLLLNTMNMINFLADGDSSGARVEARRFDILQRFFVDDDSAELMPEILGLGNYLAGAAFEAGRDYSGAARFYVKAWLQGTWPESDDRRLLDLISMTGYRGAGLGELQSEASDLLQRARDRNRVDRSTYRDRYRNGDTLIVVQTGMAPYREAQRISLAEALDYTGHSPYASLHLDSGSREQAMGLFASGLVTWLNTTRLTREGLPPPRSSVTLGVGDRNLRLTDPVDVGEQVEEAWKIINATALAAAISRAVARAAAGQFTRVVVEAAADAADTPDQVAGLLGTLSGLLLQASLAATDTPDTRSWTSLPNHIHLARVQFEPGERTVEVDVGDSTEERTLRVDPDRFNFVNFSKLR